MLSVYGESKYFIASANGTKNVSSLMPQHLKISVLHS